jgi:ParB-like chromosome segregation protein Spo0J
MPKSNILVGRKSKVEVVAIDRLQLNPNNARLHPEANIDAIKGSLAAYGQTKPLVVQRRTRIVIAGNGTLEAARQLGWTEIAVTWVNFHAGKAIGYSLADNRTAELARWDYDAVARVSELVEDAQMIEQGWSQDDLLRLRREYVPAETPANGKARQFECPKCGFSFSA